MLGTRDLPFPRLTALSYWTYLFGGLLLYSSFLFGLAPDGGWFAYVPLTNRQWSPGLNLDFWDIALSVAEIAAMGAAAEMIVAVLRMRAPGMSINRIPVFGWAMLVTAFMIIFGFTPLIVGTAMLELDRKGLTSFFVPEHGGDPLLWQHLFWVFGHPEVYIMFLPAVGIVTQIVQIFSRRPVVSYTLVVLAIIATGFLSFGLWVHHMYTHRALAAGDGLLRRGEHGDRHSDRGAGGRLGGDALERAAASGARRCFRPGRARHLRARRDHRRDGGVAAVRLAGARHLLRRRPPALRADRRHHLPALRRALLLAAQDHRPDDERAAGVVERRRRCSSASTSRSSPCTSPGCSACRAGSTPIPPGSGLETYNLLSTIGAFVFATGVLLTVVNFVRQPAAGRRRRGTIPGRRTRLEWSVTSPPPDAQFARLPVVRDRHPLWDERWRQERMRPEETAAGGRGGAGRRGADGPLAHALARGAGGDA